MTPPENTAKNTGPGKTRIYPETAYSNAVRYYRQQSECTQEEFATACDISLTILQDIESGRVKRPRLDTIKRIVIGLEALGLDINQDKFDIKVRSFELPVEEISFYTEPSYKVEESKGKEDLACVLIHIQTARYFVSELGKRTNSEQRFIQTATTIFDVFELLAKEPFELKDFCNVMRQFDCLSQEATRRDLNSLGSLMSLKDLREKLKGFQKAVKELHNPNDGLVPNGWPVEDVKHQQLIRELEMEVEGRLNKLDDLPDLELRQSTRKTLLSLKIELGLDPLNLKQVDAIRQKLEQLDQNVFRDVMMKCQLILGQYTERLPAGMVFRDWEYGPEMVVIPAGEFLMGSADGEGPNRGLPQHEVRIDYRLAVGRYPVTFEEWDCSFEKKGVPHSPKDEGWGRGRRPVIGVSWDDILYYIAWLSGRTAKNYRLLSEAEWEYACRAGTNTEFWWGDDISTDQANYGGNHTFMSGTKGEYRQQTVPVDSFEPNPWGLYNMHGNVWEWCEDHWNRNYNRAPNEGSAWTGNSDENESSRVLRGGSWDDSPESLRARYRSWGNRGNRSGIVGF